jgi:hypothetical protein
MNTKGITIKVTTSKVIALLEDKLKTMEQSQTDYSILEADYKSKRKAWEKKCVSIAVKQSSKALESDAGTSYSSGLGNTTMKVTMWFDPALFPPKPEEPEIVRRGKYSLESDVTELRDTVRMLKLHEGDTISTATYKSVARFL